MVFAPFGGLSDPIGRRAIYAFGFICLGLRYALLPSASSVTELALMRIICSLGLAGRTVKIDSHPQLSEHSDSD